MYHDNRISPNINMWATPFSHICFLVVYATYIDAPSNDHLFLLLNVLDVSFGFNESKLVKQRRLQFQLIS